MYVVPSFEAPSYDSPLEYIHIKDSKCPLPKCKEKKGKAHTLVRKEVPLCIHTVLVHSLTNTTSEPKSSTTKESVPKLDRDLTVGHVIDNISRYFPSLTKMENSGFVQKSRRYVERLHANKSEINKMIQDKTLTKCKSCPDSNLSEWSYKPRKAFLLSIGHMIQIEIPIKICTACKTVYYPGNFTSYHFQVSSPKPELWTKAEH